MRKTGLSGFAVALACVLVPGVLGAWEVYDRVAAVVNNRPIIESEVAAKFRNYSKKNRVPAAKASYVKSRMLDSFIDDALFAQTAEDESIIVGEAKIDNFIKTVMERMNIASIADFKKKIESQDNVTYEEYRDDLRRSMTRELVMSISVGVPPPSNKAAEEWYQQNKGKVGFEFNIKHILLRPAGASLAEEKRVSQKMREIRGKILSGASFESMAREYSEDGATKASGGSMGWVKLSDLDQYMAMQIYMMGRPGQVSDVIKSGAGYHLVKFVDKRIVPFESVKGIIFSILYNQNLAKQVEVWAAQKRKESDIKIYMKDYTRR